MSREKVINIIEESDFFVNTFIKIILRAYALDSRYRRYPFWSQRRTRSTHVHMQVILFLHYKTLKHLHLNFQNVKLTNTN